MVSSLFLIFVLSLSMPLFVYTLLSLISKINILEKRNYFAAFGESCFLNIHKREI